jgi:hypothetical protein
MNIEQDFAYTLILVFCNWKWKWRLWCNKNDGCVCICGEICPLDTEHQTNQELIWFKKWGQKHIWTITQVHQLGINICCVANYLCKHGFKISHLKCYVHEYFELHSPTRILSSMLSIEYWFKFFSTTSFSKTSLWTTYEIETC